MPWCQRVWHEAHQSPVRFPDSVLEVKSGVAQDLFGEADYCPGARESGLARLTPHLLSTQDCKQTKKIFCKFASLLLS